MLRRIAVIFDDETRPDTTGVYCRKALECLAKVQHFRPSDLATIPAGAFDLYLRIDDGHDYQLPAWLRPCAWWVIDTHIDFANRLERAREFDFVFAAQRNGAERLRTEGVTSATWLPLACDPDLHGKEETGKTFDLCFVGNIMPGPRAELIALLQQRFRNMFVGRCYFKEMCRTYSASRIVFNRSIADDVNMRVFEALASGSLLMTNDLASNGQAELFHDGLHLATYREPEELLDKVAFYLAHEESRERIAAAGRAEAVAKHTYRHRMEEML